MIHLNRSQYYNRQGGFQNRQRGPPRQQFNQSAPGAMPRPTQQIMAPGPAGQIPPQMMMNQPQMRQQMPPAQF